MTAESVRPPARICVTGGAGFIGAHLCRALRERGYAVRSVDLVGGVGAVRADVSSDLLEPLLEGCDAVIHLAALPGVRAGHPLPALWRHNARATARLAGALRPGQRLVLASTSSVYGDARRLPVDEDSPPSPLNPYAVTKLAAEGLARRATGPGADVVTCRLFTVFGEGQRPDMAFARWIEAIAAGRPVTWCAPRGARREFTYVGDAVCGLTAALERGRAGEVYNVAGSGSTPVDAALREIEDIVGRRARLVMRPAFSEAVATAASGEKALAELGYAPRVGLRAGLERQVEAALAPAAAPLAAA